ncbi:AzlC family ABC transporter permease [Streptomyces sp. DvalAA-19]|uniref:AzlC family ABC transporter permease n=1 Tax=Streptomyces sp. DvalAA-19 TaxID=1839761 RepID=UPI000B85C45D|nr:AzlC family ABC transporter permease [Streptomyces sp. DvalAA-19]
MHLSSSSVVVGVPEEAPALRAPGQIRLGVTHSLAAAVGVFPMGIAFGVLVTHSGLPWWWATVFAAVIFAGSLEFLLIGLVTALAPLSQIAATAFLVNFRHVFYALSFPLHRVHGPLAKTYSTFTLTDEAWALTTAPEAQTWSRRRILAIQATFQVSWVASATLGALAGGMVPDRVVGLEFAVTAFFLVLAIDAFRVTRSVPPPLAAIASALIAHGLFGRQMLVPALALFTGYLLLRYALMRRKDSRRA